MSNQELEPTSEETERRYKAPALEKGLDILELLSRTGEPLTTSQIATKLGRSVSELFRMVITLETRGYIALVGNKEGYGLTNKMFALGVAQTPSRTLIENALPVMKDLARAIGQSCHLVVASQDQIVVVARIESPRDLGFSVRVGYRRELMRSTSGVIITAMQPERRREEIMRELALSTEHELMDAFREKVAQAANRGYVQTPSDFIRGIVDISSPIMSAEGAVASLTIPYVICNPVLCTEDDSAAQLREATEKISELLRSEGG